MLREPELAAAGQVPLRAGLGAGGLRHGLA
nr:MAG TPA_asm: hypothetical protein [Caudoviricetes sp.]